MTQPQPQPKPEPTAQDYLKKIEANTRKTMEHTQSIRSTVTFIGVLWLLGGIVGFFLTLMR